MAEARESAARVRDDPEASAGRLLAVLGRAATRLYAEVLRPTGLRPRHLAALTELGAGPLSQQALAEATRTDPTKLVGVLNDLESWALVERRRDAGDRRRHVVEISACGRERLAQVDRLVADADARLLGALAPDEQRALTALLAQVAATNGVGTSCSAAAAAIDRGGEDPN